MDGPGADKTGQLRRAWLGPPLQAGSRPKALPPTRWLARAANLVASVRQVALLRLDNVATLQALRRVRACQSCRADPFHRHSEERVFVKAGCGKTARPVCAADGGQRESNRARLLRPDSCEAGEQSEEIHCGGVCRGGRSGTGGAKGGDQGKCGPAKHVPGAEPDKRVTGMRQLLAVWTRGGRSYGAGRRRLWHPHRPYELMEAAPCCKSMISAEAWPRLIRSRP